MAVDIGTQIIILLILLLMAMLTKRHYPEVSKYFAISASLFVLLCAILDVLNLVKLI